MGPPEQYTNLYDDPYDGPEPYTLTEGRGGYLTERELQRAKALYAGEITMTDRWLGRFLDRMEERGLMENTLLIVVSDPGIALGEHGFVGKPHYVLWPEVTDVIFFIRHPEGNGAGETSDYYGSSHDIAPTILGFLGIDQPQPMHGEDLSVLLGGKEHAARDHFTLGLHNFVWAHDGDNVMFGRDDGALPFAKLYDIREDPGMTRNLAAEQPDTVRRMFNDYVLKDAGGSLPKY
jgi:arylsulfatase A-like enzyme